MTPAGNAAAAPAPTRTKQTRPAPTLARLWDVRGLQFDETSVDGFHRSWIMLFPEGDFKHPEYGALHFTRRRLMEIKRQFDDRIRHIDIALDANPDQDKATGWLERLELREGGNAPSADAGTDTEVLPPGLWGLVRWTPLGMSYLKDQIYRYFSPEFGPWTDPETGHQYKDVLLGGALTNRPFLKSMGAVHLADRAVSYRAWSSVDKSCLPDSAFLDPKGRRLPVYEGAGPKDAKGRYTKRGALNLNGVKSALGAVHGARSGSPMSGLPAGIANRLQRWLDTYGTKAKTKPSTKADDGSAIRCAQCGEPITPNMSTGSYKCGACGYRGNSGSVRAMTEHNDVRAASGGRLPRRASLLEEGRNLTEMGKTYDDADEGVMQFMGPGSAKPGGSTKHPAVGQMGQKGQYGPAGGRIKTQTPDLGDSGDDDADGEDLDDASDGDQMDDGSADDSQGYDDSGEPDSDVLDDSADGDAMDDDADGGASDAASTVAMGRRGGKRGGSKKASEPRRARRMTFAELEADYLALREDHARLAYNSYRTEVGSVLDGWAKGTFQFAEGVGTATRRTRTGEIALSKSFRDRYREFMLGEGVRLSEGQRHKVNALIEQALSTAVVDLTARGTSYDQESRRTRKARESLGGPERTDAATEKALQLAQEQGLIQPGVSLSDAHDQLSKLPQEKQHEIYSRAYKLVGE